MVPPTISQEQQNTDLPVEDTDRVESQDDSVPDRIEERPIILQAETESASSRIVDPVSPGAEPSLNDDPLSVDDKSDSLDPFPKQEIRPLVEHFPVPNAKPLELPLLRLEPVGYDYDTKEKFLQNILCANPGCPNEVVPDVRAENKRFCSINCRNHLRSIRKMLREWYQETGCLYARALCELFGGRFRSSA